MASGAANSSKYPSAVRRLGLAVALLGGLACTAEETGLPPPVDGSEPSAVPDARTDVAPPSLDLAQDASAPADTAAPPAADAAIDTRPPQASPDAAAPLALVLAPASHDFGVVDVGTDADVRFVVTSTGNGITGAPTVELTGADAREFAIVVNACWGGVSPGRMCGLGIRFSPASSGTKRAMLVLTATPGGSVTATLQGTGSRPAALTIAPGAAPFGDVSLGEQSASTTFTLTNGGDVATGKLSASVGTKEFTVTGGTCEGKALKAAETCTVIVAFTPTTAGQKSGTLQVAATPGGPATAALSGTALTAAAGALVPATATFDGTVVNGTSPGKTFTLTNTGGATAGTVTALHAVLSGADHRDFHITANSCVGTLAGGASCAVTVVFKPGSLGGKSASLTVSAVPGGTGTAMLSATGVTPASLTVSPTPFELPRTGLNSTSQGQRFTVTNTGGATAGTTSAMVVSLGGADAEQFHVTDTTCTGTLAAGATCEIVAVFNPTSLGEKAGSLGVKATPGGNAVAALSGTGVLPAAFTVAAAEGSSADFGVVRVGAPVTQFFVVSNVGQYVSDPVDITVTGELFTIVAPSGTECRSGVTTLAAGTSCTVRVRLAPKDVGPVMATLSVVETTGGVPVTLALKGAGQMPAGTITEYLITAERVDFPVIVAGPDGNLWFPDTGNGTTVYRFTLLGALKAFPLPEASGPRDMTVGKDGNFWYTDYLNNDICRMTLAGAVTCFPIPTPSTSPQGITSGPGGDLWFAQIGTNSIGRITTAGVITEYPVGPEGSGPSAIVTGADGHLWFTEYGSNTIGRMTSQGVVTRFPIPTENSFPMGIARGPDNNVWFVEYGAGKVGRVNTLGQFTEYPTLTPDSTPTAITVGPDGNMWFTETAANKIGRITTAGVMTEFDVPTQFGSPSGIVAGPDGNIWFTEGVGKVGRLIP